MRVVIVVAMAVAFHCVKCYEYQELKLISQLNDFFNFDHNVLLMESSANHNRFVSVKGRDRPRTLYVFDKDNLTVVGLLTEIRSKNTFLIVVLDSSSVERNFEFFVQLRRIERLWQFNVKIEIF